MSVILPILRRFNPLSLKTQSTIATGCLYHRELSMFECRGGGECYISKDFTESATFKSLCVAGSAPSANLSAITYLCIERRQAKAIKAEWISRCGDVFSIQTIRPGNPRFPSSSSLAYVWVTFVDFLLLFVFLENEAYGPFNRRRRLEQEEQIWVFWPVLEFQTSAGFEWFLSYHVFYSVSV